MNLEDVTIRIRPRTKWEGADLGVLIVNAWWKPMLGAWLIITLPVFALLLLVSPNLNFGMIVFWWLKPIFERAHLYVISHALFGNTPTVKETVKDFWSVAKIQWFMSLSFRRFSLTRSADLPIIQLEGLQGKQRKKRIQVLHHHNMNPASWLTVLGVHIESALVLGMFVLLAAFLPQQTEFNYMAYISDTDSSYQLLTAILGYMALTLVSPFYVAAGFGTYINTRTHLEGWDIELAFRRISNRISKLKVGSMVSAALVFVSIITIGMFSGANLVSADSEYKLPEKRFHTPVTAKQEIEDVLKSKDFHSLERERRLKRKDGKDISFIEWLKGFFDGESSEVDAGSFSWIYSVGRALAIAFEVLLWAIPVVIIVYLILYFKDKKIYFKSRKKSDGNRPPVSLFGLDMREERLPDNVLDEAVRYWRSKQYRQALSLLYRASLVNMMHGHEVQFEQGDTEGDCLRKVQAKAAKDISIFFKKMTGVWIDLAYGHQTPSNTVFQQLCQSWDLLFNTRAQSPNG